MQPESDIRDGVHFGLDADTYHSIAALSSTGIKNLLISGRIFGIARHGLIRITRRGQRGEDHRACLSCPHS